MAMNEDRGPTREVGPFIAMDGPLAAGGQGILSCRSGSMVVLSTFPSSSYRFSGNYLKMIGPYVKYQIVLLG